MMIICLLALTLAACRTRNHANSVISRTASTAAMDAESADTLRSTADIHVGSIESSIGYDHETTHIHINRDSAGNPTDIHINKRSASHGQTKKETSGSAVAETSGKHQEHSETVAASEAEEAVPVKDRDRSTARKAVAWIFCLMFLFIIGSSLKRLRK